MSETAKNNTITQANANSLQLVLQKLSDTLEDLQKVLKEDLKQESDKVATARPCEDTIQTQSSAQLLVKRFRERALSNRRLEALWEAFTTSSFFQRLDRIKLISKESHRTQFLLAYGPTEILVELDVSQESGSPFWSLERSDPAEITRSSNPMKFEELKMLLIKAMKKDWPNFIGELKFGSDGRTCFEWTAVSMEITFADKQHGFDVDSKGYPKFNGHIQDDSLEYPAPDKIA